MKFLPPRKTISVVALLATLSAVASASLFQSHNAKAQTESQNPVTSTSKTGSVCEEGSFPYPEEFWIETEYGCSTIGNFYDIELTPEQEAVRQQALQQASNRSDLIEGQVEMVTQPNASIDVFTRSADSGISKEASEAASVANLDDIPNAEQIDELNARFPEAEFVLSQSTRLTPEQVLEVIMIDREFEDTMLSVMTPEQQRQYLKNMAAMYWIKGSDPDLTDG